MTPNRPYLIRAIYDWIVDNNLTPYILVNALQPGVQVPRSYVDEEGRIILNVTPIAVTGLVIGNEALEFRASFDGHLQHLYIPTFAIIAIYAFENGRGLVFGPEDEEEEGDGGNDEQPPPPPKGPPKLSVVK